MFNINIGYLILGMLILGIIISIINYKRKNQFLKFNLEIIIFPILFYWLCVTLTSPYIALRYILPLIVLIYVVIFSFLKMELDYFVENKKFLFVIMTLICVIYSSIFWINDDYKYQYYSNKDKFEIIEKYKSIPCVYMYSHDTVLYNSFVNNLNYVRKFDNVYIANNYLFSTTKIEKELEKFSKINGFIFVDNENDALNKINKIITRSKKFNNYKKLIEINNDTAITTGIYLIY